MNLLTTLKRRVPKKIKAEGVNFLYFFANVFRPKVFCISMQRNGTTSCGEFLKNHGYRVAGYGQQSRIWSYKWLIGDYEGIFKSISFQSYSAYQDNPWWMPDFYKVLHKRFPKAKFILFQRDSDKWFDSMLSHSGGRTLGNTYTHCKIYQRLPEYYDKLDNDPAFKPIENEVDNLLILNHKRDHYKVVYDEYNREVVEYFKKHAPSKLFVTQIEDKSKWEKLGRFLGIEIEDGYDVHVHKSTK